MVSWTFVLAPGRARLKSLPSGPKLDSFLVCVEGMCQYKGKEEPEKGRGKHTALLNPAADVKWLREISIVLFMVTTSFFRWVTSCTLQRRPLLEHLAAIDGGLPCFLGW